MKRDSSILPLRLVLLLAGAFLVGAVLWLGLRSGRQEPRRIGPAVTAKNSEKIEPAAPSLPPVGSSPIADLKKFNAALRSVLVKSSPSSSPENDPERAEMRRIVRLLMPISLPIDFDGLARQSLAGHWEDIHADQRDEFVRVVRTLVALNLSEQLYRLRDYDLRFINETIAGSEATVAATLEFPHQGKRARVMMECKLIYKRGSWLVYDVIADQQSMLENYRAEFDKIITQESFDVLLARMKKRLKKIE